MHVKCYEYPAFQHARMDCIALREHRREGAHEDVRKGLSHVPLPGDSQSLILDDIDHADVPIALDPQIKRLQKRGRTVLT
jgi:hypothetical protein